jgi:hypothetical protein
MNKPRRKSRYPLEGGDPRFHEEDGKGDVQVLKGRKPLEKQHLYAQSLIIWYNL